MESQTITWNEFRVYALQLANLIKERKQFKGIIAVARGGMIPAVILSHALGIPIQGCLYMSSYADFAQQPVRIVKDEELFKTIVDLKLVDDMLFVDDIIDSGNSLKAIQAMPGYENANVVAPLGRESTFVAGAIKYRTFVKPPKMLADGIWADFPWEV